MATHFWNSLSLERRAQLRRLGAIPISRHLALLATWYGTDKGPRGHAFTTQYQQHFGRRRTAVRSMLEIGVGGHETNSGGSSLRMWRSFFPKAEIIGVDIYKKHLPPERRITIVQGDQSDPGFLAELAVSHGPFDVVVDDGSHRGDHIQVTFQALWPNLNPRGHYIIEDLETAYDEAYGGGPPGTPGTAMSLLKDLLDRVQHHGGHATFAVHVYPGIAIIEKR
jgi:hypothetical protein